VRKLAERKLWHRTVRTMIAEVSTKKTQAQAFSLMSFTGNAGILLGPLIGML